MYMYVYMYVCTVTVTVKSRCQLYTWSNLEIIKKNQNTFCGVGVHMYKMKVEN